VPEWGFGKTPTGRDGASNLPIIPFFGNSASVPNGGSARRGALGHHAQWGAFESLNSARHQPAIIIALAQRTLAVPVLYLFSTQLSLADALSIVFRGISLPQWAIKETLLNTNQTRRPTQFPLRLARSLKQAAGVVTKEQGISLNHFISLAVAEKISRIENQAEPSANSEVPKLEFRANHRPPGNNG
jgi:hypothetical protein